MDLPDLTSDCAQCAALCCVALTLDAGALFAFDKPAGTPCVNLSADHKCRIHDQLADTGQKGCVLYDCAGAGQRVTQMRFNGESWRDAPELLSAMVRDFENLRPLHERMLQLVEAGKLDLPEALETQRLTLLKRLSRVWSDTPKMADDFGMFLDSLRQIEN